MIAAWRLPESFIDALPRYRSCEVPSLPPAALRELRRLGEAACDPKFWTHAPAAPSHCHPGDSAPASYRGCPSPRRESPPLPGFAQAIPVLQSAALSLPCRREEFSARVPAERPRRPPAFL